MTITVATFYKFVEVADGAALCALLEAECQRLAIKGTILVAPEGINATISGAADAVAELLRTLRSDARFDGLVSKQSFAEEHPFRRLKVRLKREIVTFGVPEVNPARRTGIPVAGRDWNVLLEDLGVVVIDTRNDYEVAVGTFPGAVDPQTAAFSGFPDYVRQNLDPKVHQKIAMFCTGGIRCEKAAAYLLAQGFPEVYQLDGGILKYLETVPAAESLWQGECFVFDERVALQHGLDIGTHGRCSGCGDPVAAGRLSCLKCGTPEKGPIGGSKA
jgi:UPF0176 protein